MRISEDRYFRDLRPLRLAARMLELEARTRTICMWTGLTRDRVRKLAGSVLPADSRQAGVRHRGRSPLQTAYFFRSPRTRIHANAIACYLVLVGVLPDDVTSAREFPSLTRGELLCTAYETYHAGYADVLIDFERAILLATALAQRDEVSLVRCGDCGGMMIIDLFAKYSAATRLCDTCKLPAPDIDISRYLTSTIISEPEQMRLFDAPGATEPSRLDDCRSPDEKGKPDDD
jgi:hypothetical protein